jgi:hypothetical protein
MCQAEVRIGDVHAAVSAYGVLSRLAGTSKFPVDPSEFSVRLSRISGRARPLAVALNSYIERHGFDSFRVAVDTHGIGIKAAPASKKLSDAEAAATASVMNFDELDRTALTFSAAGLY